MKSKGRFALKRFVDDTVGFLLFKIFSLRKKGGFPEEINTIVIYKLSAIGDSILTLPMIKKLKQGTKAKIIVVHSSDNKIVFENQSFIDKTILLNVSGKNPFALVSSLRKIRKEKPDIAIDLSHTGNLSGIFALVSSKNSAGFFNPEIPRRKGFYLPEIKMDLENHMIYNYFKILDMFDIEDKSFPKLLPLKTKGSSKILGKGENYVGVHPCHEIDGKSWDEKKFAKVIDFLVEKGKTPVILGSPKEVKKVEKLLDLVKDKGRVVDLSGKVSLEDTYSIMKKMDFFVANDGGVMHMAASLGIPTLGIFNVDTPVRYAPFNERSLGVGKESSGKKVGDILREEFLSQ